MSDDLLRVDGNLFFGRVSEQRRFREALAEVLREPEGEPLPYVFLLFGDGGIGKSTLLRRCRDIAQREFPGQVTLFLVDWERAQPDMGRAHVGAETLLDALHRAARERGWAHHFARYREALVARQAAEQQALSSLSVSEGRDELAALRGLDGERLMRFMRLGTRGERLARFLREAAKLHLEAAEALRLRAAAENHLRGRLTTEALALFLTPHEQLAQALAEGFREVATDKPLLVALDTYEVMARADLWLRRLMLAAGPRLLWVVAGRDNLVGDRELGGEFVGGYASDFPGRLVDLDMKQLAESDIRAYFAAAVPERPLEAEPGALEGVRRATRGIPLAVRQAADIWKRHRPLSDIVGDSDDATPGLEIVQKMTARYFLHCLDNEADQRALYALALAGGDGPLLAELLKHLAGDEAEAGAAAPQGVVASAVPSLSRVTLHKLLVGHFNRNELGRLCFLLDVSAETIWGESDKLPEMSIALLEHCEKRGRMAELIEAAHSLNPDAPWPAPTPAPRSLAPARAPTPALFDMTPTVQELRQRYASVQRDAARLHDEPAAFLLEDLRLNQRERPWAQALLRRAAEVMRERVERKARDFDLIEECCADEDWVTAVVRRTGLLFWLTDEGEQAWKWLVPRLVEGLAYSRPLRQRLLAEARRWKGQLSHQGRKRLAALNPVTSFYSPPDEQAAMLDELERLAKRDYLREEGGGEAERRAILAWQRGLLLAKRKAYTEALRCYDEAERGLPEGGQALKQQLGEALNDLAGKLLWPEQRGNSRYPAEAERILSKVVLWLPENGGAWYNLGVAFYLAGEYEESLAAYQRALELEERATRYDGLGIVYHRLGRYEEAEGAYQQAIALDATYASPHDGLGSVYQKQGRYEEAEGAYQQAIALDPTYADPHQGLGGMYATQGRYAEAIEACQHSLELGATDAVLYAALGLLHALMGRYEDAMTFCQRVAAAAVTDTALYAALGLVYVLMGRYEDAEVVYQQAIEVDAMDASLHEGLGKVYQNLGQYEEATASYKRAVELDPNGVSIRISLAGVYRKLGQEAEYRHQVEIARDILDREETYELACFESICGNLDEALTFLQQAITQAPVQRDAARRDPDFDFIRNDPRFRALVGEENPPEE